MKCSDVMVEIKVALIADDPLDSAVAFMQEKHMGLVPVTERDGTFAGLIAGDGLMRACLPKTLNIIRNMSRVSYLRESKEELKERLSEIRSKPVRTILEPDVKTVFPDTPLIEALMLLSRKQNVVPVVDRQTNKLLGAISFFSVLKAVEREDE